MTTILLVDNDPLQASLRKSILERRFSEVERVADAAEALCLVEQPQFAGHLGLVVSGLNMPGIGGPAFVAELHDRLPNVPVLVLGSGGGGQQHAFAHEINDRQPEQTGFYPVVGLHLRNYFDLPPQGGLILFRHILHHAKAQRRQRLERFGK